jgi:hypothetical protein
MIVTHFMGRSGPPGRRGAQRDVGHRPRAATPAGGPIRPTEGRGLLLARRVAGALWCPTPRCHPLLASEQETAVKGVTIIEIWYQEERADKPGRQRTRETRIKERGIRREAAT